VNQSAASAPIIVGIDGSKFATRAAIWAADEAVSRDTKLRLLHVINSHTDLDREYAHASQIIHEAWVAVEATGKPVKLESDIREGDPVDVLVELSRSAAMICVGSSGTNDSSHHRRGFTADRLALAADCPVAIVRRRHTRQPPPAGYWIIAALDESTDSRGVLQAALEEAQLRDAPVLALTRWLTDASDVSLTVDEQILRKELNRYVEDGQYDNAEVQVCTLPMPTHLTNLLAQSADIDQLCVVGPGSPDLIAEVVGPKAHSILHKTNCSLLILRDGSDS
jgi:nucleotide-binding universal stress UspA family protein